MKLHFYLRVAIVLVVVFFSFSASLGPAKFVLSSDFGSSSVSNTTNPNSTFIHIHTLGFQQSDYHAGLEEQDVSVSIIVVASEQRSSSTFLSHDVIGSMPCHLSLNEILIPSPQQSGDAWSTLGQEMNLNQSGAKDNDPVLLANFILRVAKRRCHQKLEEQQQQDSCNHHCWVNYKHFGCHLNDNQHEVLWDALLEQQNLAHNNLSVVVLERDVTERWRSKWFAEQTGDWQTHGSAEHKARLAMAKVPVVQSKFIVEHNRWYRRIRNYYTNLEKDGMPVVELNFQNLTTRDINVTRAILRDNISLGGHSLLQYR